MMIIGLTGSIASGKSTVAKWINDLGIASHDADHAVHELLEPGGDAVAEVLAIFGPHLGSLATGVNRRLFGDEVFAAPQKRKQLESILHPMVRKHRDAFIARQYELSAPAVVLDVPLLFETGGDKICDHVIVVYASVETTLARALARPGMTRKKLGHILASQISTDHKKAWANLALDTDLSKEETYCHLMEWLSKIGLSILATGHLKPTI